MKKTKIPKVALGLLMTAVLLFSATAQAGVPSLISYQGKLADADGAPVDDGDYTFDVKLGTEDGSTIIFESGAIEVPVADGLYALEIGPVEDLLGMAENDIFLHLMVEDETFPPVALKSVPYALLSTWAASVADGSITESSLDEGLSTTIALVPDLEMDLMDVASQIDVSGDLTIGELVNALRGVTEPVWTSKTTYIIDKGVSFSKVNAFAFAGPSLMNPQNGNPANRPVITIEGTLPPGLSYSANSDTLSGNPTTVGEYPLTLIATDMLGQTVSQDVVIEVIDIEMGAITGEITNATALNLGPLADGANGVIIAGDTVELTQNISGDVDKIAGFPFFWDVPSAVSSSDIETGQTLIDVAKVFTTGLPGMPTTNHEGFYSTELVLDFGQTIPGDSFEIGDIDPGFSLDDLTYDGDDDPSSFYIITAGNDSDDLGITANLFPGFNGVAMFQWYVARNDDDSNNTVMAIDGARFQNFSLEDAIQVLDEDGYALQNGDPHPLPNYGEDSSFYFPAVSNGFADLTTVDPDPVYWQSETGDNVEFRVNDNINIADDPDDKTEYAGYDVDFGVVAGTTNFIGSLSYEWLAQDDNGDAVPGTTTTDGNSFMIAGENLDSDQEPYDVSVTVTSTLSDVDLAKERSTAILDLEPAILAVPAGIEVVWDVSNDASPIIADTSPDAYFGIYEPNTDSSAATETVNINTDVTFQAIVWVPAALLSDQDDGEFVDFNTPPSRALSVKWFLDPDAGGEVITIPESNVSGPDYIQVDPSGLNRVGVRWFMTLENVQQDDNNDADGKYWAEVSSPTGTFSFESVKVDLTVDD